MRLVCPKCGAQYEVEAGAIPAGGREVQCSDCGHGWFQQRPVTPPQKTLAAAVALPVSPPPFPAPPTPAERSVAARPREAGAAGDAPPSLPRKPLDEHVMAILREEALREVAARRNDAVRDTGKPPQPAPVTDGVPPSASGSAPVPPEPRPSAPPVPPRVARDAELPTTDGANDPSARTRTAPSPVPAERSRTGFRAGFWAALGMILLAAAAYVLAPRIVDLVPRSAEVMTTYVGSVDDLRRRLDATVKTAQTRVESMLLPAQ